MTFEDSPSLTPLEAFDGLDRAHYTIEGLSTAMLALSMAEIADKSVCALVSRLLESCAEDIECAASVLQRELKRCEQCIESKEATLAMRERMVTPFSWFTYGICPL